MTTKTKTQINGIKTFIPRLAEAGKIKIGGKGKEITTKNGKKMRIPEKYDHFVITKMERDQHGNLIKDQAIHKIIGEQPKELFFTLLYDDIQLNFYTAFALYSGHKCFCRGDGEKAIRMIKTDKKDKKGQDIYKHQEIICPAGDCEYLINEQCKPCGILSAVLQNTQEMGIVHKFRTHAWNSVQNIMSSLAYIQMQTGGKLAGIPLKMSIIKKATEDHGNVITVNVSFAGTPEQLAKAVVAETKRREMLKLDILKLENMAKQIGITDDTDDPQEVEEEFYNESEIITNKSKAQTIDADMFVTPAVIEEEQKEPKKEDHFKKEGEKKMDIEDLI